MNKPMGELLAARQREAHLARQSLFAELHEALHADPAFDGGRYDEAEFIDKGPQRRKRR